MSTDDSNILQLKIKTLRKLPTIQVIIQLHNGERVVCWMTDVLCVPKITNNLFSVHAATSRGNTVSFKHNDCCIWNN